VDPDFGAQLAMIGESSIVPVGWGGGPVGGRAIDEYRRTSMHYCPFFLFR
jgi:hypothetical protein